MCTQHIELDDPVIAGFGTALLAAQRRGDITRELFTRIFDEADVLTAAFENDDLIVLHPDGTFTINADVDGQDTVGEPIVPTQSPVDEQAKTQLGVGKRDPAFTVGF